MADIVEQIVNPQKPRVIAGQEVKVYTPIATSNQKGIASYDNNDFIVDSNGMVSLRHSLKTQMAQADPLSKISLIKLLASEFEHLSPEDTEYDVNSPLGVVRFNRAQLSAETLEKPSLVWLKKGDFNKILDIDTNRYRQEIAWPQYPFNGGGEELTKDMERKAGFSLDSAYFGYSNPEYDPGMDPDHPNIPDSKAVKPLLPRAPYYSAARERENGYGAIRIDTRIDSKNKWLIYIKEKPVDVDPFAPEEDFEDPHHDKLTLSFNPEALQSYLTKDSGLGSIVPNYGNPMGLEEYLMPDSIDGLKQRKLAYIANYVKDGYTLEIDGVEYTNGAQLPYGTTYNRQTMVQRTVFLLDKNSMGLGLVENLSPAQMPISEATQEAINTIEEEKLDKNQYITDKAATDSRIEELETRAWGEHKYFLGYLTVPEGSTPEEYLNTNYPVTTPGYSELTSIFVTNTNTLWGWTATSWFNTDANVIGADAFQYKLNGTIKKLIVNSEFEVEFNNALPNLNLSIPYVTETKYLHNWQGQTDFVSGKYKKLWVGTSAEYQADFNGQEDESVLAMITDDTYVIEGQAITQDILEERLDDYTLKLLRAKNSVEVGHKYVIAPVATKSGVAPEAQGWYLEEWVPEQFVQTFVPWMDETGIVNIEGWGDPNREVKSGLLTYNEQNFALVSRKDSITDANLGLKYKTIGETVSGNIVSTGIGRAGTRPGAYLTLSDFSFVPEGKADNILKTLLDTNYKVNNYSNWTINDPGATTSVGIQVSVNKLWSATNTLRTEVVNSKANIADISLKLSAYPSLSPSNYAVGAYVFTVKQGEGVLGFEPLATYLPSGLLTQDTEIPAWTQGTSGQTIAAAKMTPNNLASLFATASQVRLTGEGNNSPMKFWSGTTAQFRGITTKQTNTLYIVTEGQSKGIYLGSSTVLAQANPTGAEIVNTMSESNVQALLNKLPNV